MIYEKTNFTSFGKSSELFLVHRDFIFLVITFVFATELLFFSIGVLFRFFSHIIAFTLALELLSLL